VAALVRQAYEKVAPRALAESIGETVDIKPPAALSPEEIDPLKSRRAQTVLTGLRKICLSWPEVAEDQQFGSPVWRAGKKTFVWLHADRNTAGAGRRPRPRLQLYFWVGVTAQSFMTADTRFQIPPYIGHQGWIALDVTEHCDWKEVRGLALSSYRHFALQRMVKLLGAEEG
jgi:hypothetical protein